MHFVPAVNAPEGLKGERLWMVFQGHRLLLADDPAASVLPELRDASWLGLPEISRHYLGTLDGKGLYAVAVADDVLPPEGYRFEDLRRLLGQVDDSLFGVAGRAFQILEWDRNHRHCGRCGTLTAADARGERSKVCPACGFSQYPRINPCVIVVVTRGEELLLARAQRFNRPMYSALAGFIEAGESAEETLVREVQEEVGVQVGAPRYFGSQSWPFPGNLMLGFHAEYRSGDIVLQEEEIADARFFHFSELPPIPPAGSIAHALIQDFVARCRA
ncbi:MAG: NAD(+) diphosphatase [Moraxellaceae bacterium]|nr:NAD(+) diphosphatase [Moraxellaceae bacterium]